jgi:hypothetical protein
LDAEQFRGSGHFAGAAAAVRRHIGEDRLRRSRRRSVGTQTGRSA